jgi:DNA uptake protein ComE-like DNA-binding protein
MFEHRLRRAARFAGVILVSGMVACGGAPDSAPSDEAEAAATETPAAEPASTGLLNPNLADEAQINGLAGMSPAAAEAILEGRPFLDMLTLDAAIAPHLEEAAREALYGSMWVPVNLNTASEAELLLIPGVGDRMAYEFDEYRPYDGMARFQREIGKYVDEETVENYARYVFIAIELNTASDEDILAIPGVGDRMLHEFKEYRPFESMEHFMREIGKYVDDDELARLARYVTLADGQDD